MLKLAEIIDIIKTDFFLSKHSKYFINEMRVKVYSQFLSKHKY